MSILGNTKVKEKLIGNIHLLKKVNGYSAYELAVKNGFEGTEKEWLASLKGDKGEKGTLESHSGFDALGNRVVNVATPEENGDAVNKEYADRVFATHSDVEEKDNEIKKYADETFETQKNMTNRFKCVTKNVTLDHNSATSLNLHDDVMILSIRATLNDDNTAPCFCNTFYIASTEGLPEQHGWWVEVKEGISNANLADRDVTLLIYYANLT